MQKCTTKNWMIETRFYLPIPLVRNGNDITEFSGFDANYGTYSYRNISQLNIPQAGGGFFSRNLEDGIHPKVDVVGSEFKYDLGNNITVLNKTRYTNIDLNYTGIFPAGGPTSAADFAKKKRNHRQYISIFFSK